MRSTHAPTVGNQTIPGLSFLDDLTIGPFRVNGLQRRMDHDGKNFVIEGNKCVILIELNL